MRILTVLTLLIAGTAHAQGFDQRSNDFPLTAEELQTRLSGQILTFYDDGQSEFFPDGRYSYTYADEGGTAYGYWKITDGAVCVSFLNGFERCDLYVSDGARLVLLDEKGARYPVRP
jgi:hypothetical protein